MTEAELDRFSRNGSTFYLKSRLFASPASLIDDEPLVDPETGEIIEPLK